MRESEGDMRTRMELLQTDREALYWALLDVLEALQNGDDDELTCACAHAETVIADAEEMDRVMSPDGDLS